MLQVADKNSNNWTREQNQIWYAVEKAVYQISFNAYVKQKGKKKKLKQFSAPLESSLLIELREKYLKGEIEGEAVMASLGNYEILKARFSK